MVLSSWHRHYQLESLFIRFIQQTLKSKTLPSSHQSSDQAKQLKPQVRQQAAVIYIHHLHIKAWKTVSISISTADLSTVQPGAVLRWGRGGARFTCCPPQNQQLADRFDVISEVPKCSKIQISTLDLTGGAYSAPPDSIADGENLPLALSSLGLVSTGHRV